MNGGIGDTSRLETSISDQLFTSSAVRPSMKQTGSVKVPNGKLVTVAVSYGDTIESITITGDFFLEPPAARADLERVIEGRPTDVSKHELIEAIETVDARLIGFSADHLAEAVREAIGR